MDDKLETEIKRAIAMALEEDQTHHDITSKSCFAAEQIATARFLLKEEARIVGLPFLGWIFEGLDINLLVKEGSDCSAGTFLATVTGPIHTLLARERTALNVLQHSSGIATQTARYVRAAAGHCDILDTRKTLPGLRYLQKYAVRMGGGKNHRFHLAERILIKNNHLKWIKEGSFREMIERARLSFPKIKIEVEVENLQQIEEVLKAPIDFIMLDNMSLSLMEKAVGLIQKKVYVEASGGMTLERIPAVAATGVDGISVGALTHSVKAIDISLRFDEPIS